MAQDQPTKVEKKKKSVLKRAAQARQRVHAYASATSNRAIGVIAHRQCRLIWLILHKATLYEERGPAVTKRSKYRRTWRMIRQLQHLGYRIESPNLQPSQAQAQ